MTRLRWLWLAPIAFLTLRILGGQLVEEAVDHRDPPETYGPTLLADAELFSVGTYLAGLAGLAFLWFAWALRHRLRQEGEDSAAEAMAFGGAVLWGGLYVGATALSATAPLLADYYDDPYGARLVTGLDFATAPLALTLLAVFVLGNGFALRRTPLVPRWLAWTGALLGVVLVIAAALQPIVEPTVSRSEEEVNNAVSFITGFASFALVPLWTIAVGVALFRRDGRAATT